jgi:8-oxo-dGTP pyrophosphatase MutT (NUDIX family)
MSRYVLVHAVSVDRSFDENSVLLVKKNKPEWQKGFLNLLGGSVEPGELPERAAVRELFEESGLEPFSNTWEKEKPQVTVVEMGRIDAANETVHCFRIFVSSVDLNPRPSETEIVRWYNWQSVKDDSRLLPSTRVILPLMMNGVHNWQMTVPETFMNKEFNTVYLTVPSNKHKRFKENPVVTKIIKGE